MPTKKELLQQAVAQAVGAGRVVALETVDFNDPNRPKTCLEVDFPILPVNQVAVIEGNAGKPIYQMSKWWARRRSSVFRAMLIAAAAKAPDDPAHAAKLVWDNYYANHQKKGAFKHLKVADIFMGGGTTLVEGARLGMQMLGNDLNPVAWFVVKQELANVDVEQVKKLLADIEAEVKPQLMPFYCCDGPEGEKGTWTHLPSGRVMPDDFDPLAIPRSERKDYKYEGPEAIYTFWAKHGPCQVTGCGHRTPIMRSAVMAVKTLTVKAWAHDCGACGEAFDVEAHAARMAPDVPLYVAPGEAPYSVLDPQKGVVCPHCGYAEPVNLGKGKNKKVNLALLVHPQWLAGEAKQDENGQPYGGSAQDDAASTARWNQARSAKIRLLEVRGALPAEVTDPETGATFAPNQGSVSKKSSFACAACGSAQDVLTSVKATGKTGAMAAYAVQGYAPKRDKAGKPYGGRFFAAFDARMARQYDAACAEWDERKEGDLKDWWPRCQLSEGWKTHGWSIPEHGLTHYWTMFNPRQLLVHTQLLKAIVEVGDYDWAVREYVLGAFQQYLRNQNMFCFWDISRDCLAPHLSNNNYHPKNNTVENCIFPALGRGNWASSVEGILEGHEWTTNPWEAVSTGVIEARDAALAAQMGSAKSEKVFPGDAVQGAQIGQGSSTELVHIPDASLDLVITDPPFGGLMQYAELSDFFYVWLRLALKDKYPDIFGAEYTPKSLEAVANPYREPDAPDDFYQRLLTQCWREAHRALKPGGILAFTFHHSEDKPWVAVLESLFDAGYCLEATYPIRSDETKGTGEFGSQKIEYDIIHVCRKRTEEPAPISWARLRREVQAEVRQLQSLLENHARAGLPDADLRVIQRGKALEYFSRHYGKVFLDEGKSMPVEEALRGINQIIDEGAETGREAPPPAAEPLTRQFLRTFGTAQSLPRDQMQKFLRGSATTPDDFVQHGWCSEVKKEKKFVRANPLEFAHAWTGRHRRRLTSDMDQALVLIGACFDGSGINAQDTLKNGNFKPHVALRPLLEWLHRNGPDQTTRNAAQRALTIYNAWLANQAPQPVQGRLFDDEEE